MDRIKDGIKRTFSRNDSQGGKDMGCGSSRDKDTISESPSKQVRRMLFLAPVQYYGRAHSSGTQRTCRHGALGGAKSRKDLLVRATCCKPGQSPHLWSINACFAHEHRVLAVSTVINLQMEGSPSAGNAPQADFRRKADAVAVAANEDVEDVYIPSIPKNPATMSMLANAVKGVLRLSQAPNSGASCHTLLPALHAPAMQHLRIDAGVQVSICSLVT